MIPSNNALSSLMALCFSLEIAGAAELTLKVVEKNPPREVDAAVTATLQKTAYQLLDGDKPVLEFWFASEVQLQARPASDAKALEAVRQTTLLGAIAVAASRRDYRDDELPAGTYTMRFGLQPQDGNHLGTAEFAYFVALIPAQRDRKPDGIADFKAMIKASSQETSTDHPIILSLRPAGVGGGEPPRIVEPAPEHKGLRVKLPAKATGAKADLAFDLVFEGKSHK